MMPGLPHRELKGGGINLSNATDCPNFFKLACLVIGYVRRKQVGGGAQLIVHLCQEDTSVAGEGKAIASPLSDERVAVNSKEGPKGRRTMWLAAWAVRGLRHGSRTGRVRCRQSDAGDARTASPTACTACLGRRCALCKWQGHGRRRLPG